MKILKLKDNIDIRELFRFIVVGSWATIINYLLFYTLFEILDINYLVSSAFGFIVGVFSGYNFNRKWTFKVKKYKKRSETISYFIVYMVSLIISLLFLEILVNIAGLDPKIANLLTIGLTTCTNYIGVKKIVFNK